MIEATVFERRFMATRTNQGPSMRSVCHAARNSADVYAVGQTVRGANQSQAEGMVSRDLMFERGTHAIRSHAE